MTAWIRIGSVAVAVLLLAPPATVASEVVATAVAAERLLSDAQLKKLNGRIADKGRDIVVSAIITDILGLTRNGETISSRAYAERDSANADEVHVLFVLPAGKGYLEERFHQDRIEVYWADKDLVLISAQTGIRGAKPAIMSFQEAQAGFDNELKWWAKFADAN